MGRSPVVGLLRRAGIPILAGLLGSLTAGCDAPADKRFAAPTSDEYTEPLTNAIIGSPSGITVMPGTDTGDLEGAESALTISPNGPLGAAGGRSGGGVVAGAGGASSTDGGMVTDGGGPPEPVDHSGQASWLFDDCDPTSNFLVDSSGGGANAQHALKASCVPGIDGQAVQFRTTKDVVQVPDEPEFTVGPRVGVSAWVHPTTVTGDQPIVIKRLGNRTAFSLGIHNGNIEMAVVLTTGKTVISRAPISPGVWTHVGGTFDGTFVFLFINGQQFGQIFAAGTLRNVFAPLRIGATTQTQHFDGAIDNVFVSTLPDARDQIIAQSCLGRPSLLAISPATSGPVPFGTTVRYDVTVTDNDFGACAPKSYQMFFQFFDPNISTQFATSPFQSALPGETLAFPVDVTGSEDAEVGEHQLPFVIDSFGNNFESLSGQLIYELTAPDCFVSTRKELMITSTSVVDDAVRTSGTAIAPAGSTATPGIWTFGHLMREMAPTPADAPAMTLQLFQRWLSNQTVNGFTVAARPLMQRVVLDAWPKTPTGELDLDRSPLTLLAIVNRMDVRDLASGNAGEGRFVFGVRPPSGFPLQFTVILEYHLVAKTPDDVMAWANRWHALSSHPFPSEEYNAALEDITKRFAGRDAQPGAANGSALDELRTNEIALAGEWELRGFALSPTTGFFDEVTVKETPDLRFNGTAALANLINTNAEAIKAVVPAANGHTIPEQLDGAGFLAGSSLNSGFVSWNAPGIGDPDARFHMSLNTCNGCHGQETNTRFLMVNPRFPGQESSLSLFLTGTTVFDRTTGQRRTLNDLARRRTDLTGLVCGTSGDGGITTPPPATDGGSSTPPPATDGGVPPLVDSGSRAPDAMKAPPPTRSDAAIGV